MPEADDLNFEAYDEDAQAAYDKMIADLRDEYDSGEEAITPDDMRDGSQWASLTIYTNTMVPERPRTLMAGYDKKNYILTVMFRDNTLYNYYDVSRGEWDSFRDSPSSNDYIIAVLDNKSHGPALTSERSEAAYKGLGRYASRYKSTKVPGFAMAPYRNVRKK